MSTSWRIFLFHSASFSVVTLGFVEVIRSKSKPVSTNLLHLFHFLYIFYIYCSLQYTYITSAKRTSKLNLVFSLYTKSSSTKVKTSTEDLQNQYQQCHNSHNSLHVTKKQLMTILCLLLLSDLLVQAIILFLCFEVLIAVVTRTSHGLIYLNTYHF